MNRLIPLLCLMLAFSLGWVSHIQYISYVGTLPLIPEEATTPPAQSQPLVEYPPLPEGAINDLR